MWCFAGSMDFSSEDLSGAGTSPLLESTVGKAFISVKESVRGGFNFATEGNPVRVAAAGKGSSLGDEGPALRFRTSNSDEDYRSNPGTVPDRLSPDPALPSRRPHHDHDLSPDGSGQPAPRSDDLGQVRGHSVGFHVGALLDPRFFSGETRFLRILSPLDHWPFPSEGNNCGESSRSGSRPRRGSPPEGSTSNTSGAPSNRLRRPRPSRL